MTSSRFDTRTGRDTESSRSRAIGGRPPRRLAFDHNKVIRQLENESFYSSILNVKVGEKSQAAIVKDIQRHPARPIILHMDFQRIVEDLAERRPIYRHLPGCGLTNGVLR